MNNTGPQQQPSAAAAPHVSAARSMASGAAWASCHVDVAFGGGAVGDGGARAAELLHIVRELMRRELPPSLYLPPAARRSRHEREALRACEAVVASLMPLARQHVRCNPAESAAHASQYSRPGASLGGNGRMAWT